LRDPDEDLTAGPTASYGKNGFRSERRLSRINPRSHLIRCARSSPNYGCATYAEGAP